MNMKTFPAMVLAMACAVACGCSRQQEQPISTEGGVNASAKVSDTVTHLVQQDIRVVAPAQAPDGSKSLFHKIGEDAVEAVTPMADAEFFTALVGSGDHDVTLTQDGCGFDVEVEVKSETGAAVLAIIKLSQSGQRTAILPGSEQETRRVTAHMAADAENNFDCNLMLRKRL